MEHKRGPLSRRRQIQRELMDENADVDDDQPEREVGVARTRRVIANRDHPGLVFNLASARLSSASI